MEVGAQVMTRETDPVTLAKNQKELEMETTYKIVRKHRNSGELNYTVVSGLTLAQAKAHCHDPETSSDTCSNKALVEYTRVNGEWFDVFYED